MSWKCGTYVGLKRDLTLHIEKSCVQFLGFLVSKAMRDVLAVGFTHFPNIPQNKIKNLRNSTKSQKNKV